MNSCTTMAMDSVLFTNLNPDYTSTSSGRFWRPSSMTLCCALPFSSCTRFRNLSRSQTCKASSVKGSVASPRGFSAKFVSPNRQNLLDRVVVALAASQEESKLSDEKENPHNLEVGTENSQEAWKQALAAFKEHALHIQGVSQEAYDLYSKKAMGILKETSEQLHIQADKARHDLSVIAKEVGEESKEYLSTAAENSPEHVKDIVETFASSSDDLTEISKVRDFYLGIPYGAILSAGGFLSFMLTGSITAIRFGVILGGTLLLLSAASLRSWKKRDPFPLAVKGQAVIASIIFLRQLCLAIKKSSFVGCIPALISGAAAMFFWYRIIVDRKQMKGPNLERGTEA